MKTSLITLALFCMATMLHAQQRIELKLWPNGAPNDNGLTTQNEKGDKNVSVEQVATAELFVYCPEKPNGMTIVMCPGGGYWGLAMGHEGHDMASWFNAQGITYAVLKYRMPNKGHYEVPLTDAEQAMRIMREHAAEWKINPRRIGVMGASAGGHLAASLATLFTSEETRPDFQILFYPVISMEQGTTHGGSRDNLLGNSPSAELVQKYSLENQVKPNTPQAFIMLSSDDGAVVPQNSVNYYLALLANKVPVTLHSYPTGGHGWGFRDSFIYKRQWTGELEKWLREGLIFP